MVSSYPYLEFEKLTRAFFHNRQLAHKYSCAGGFQRGFVEQNKEKSCSYLFKELPSILFRLLSFINYNRAQGIYSNMGISRMRDFYLSEQKKLLKTRRIITHLSDDIQGGLSYSLIRKCIGMNRSLG